MKGSIRIAVLGAVLLLCGCAGRGDTARLTLQALPLTQGPAGPAAETDPRLYVLIMPFEDHRAAKSALGTRTHLGGGTTTFDVLDGKAGVAVAKVLTDHLRQRGWQATMERARDVHTPDVTLAGELLELTAHAKSRFGSTKMTVRSRMAVRIINGADASVARFAVHGARTESVMSFEPEYLEQLLNEVLRDGFDKFLSDTKVEHGTLQLR